MLVSSAKIFADVYDKQFGRSLYKRNNSGPKFDPWGTPQRIFCCCDLFLPNLVLLYCIKTLFKDTSPVNGTLISTGGVYNVKNYKRFKEKKDYLQIGVTPDVMVTRSYNLFQVYIVLELSFRIGRETIP